MLEDAAKNPGRLRGWQRTSRAGTLHSRWPREAREEERCPSLAGSKGRGGGGSKRKGGVGGEEIREKMKELVWYMHVCVLNE